MSEWDIATAAVTEDGEQLAAMTTHGEIYEWAKARDLATRTLWPKVKAQLRRQLGIDYELLRDLATEQRVEELAKTASSAPTIALWAAGSDDAGTFAVCDIEGEALWYGRFHRDDRIYRAGDEASAWTSAVEKAVYLAGQARRETDHDTVRLTVRVSDHHIDNRVVLSAGVSARVMVTIENTDETNPAADWCQAPGFKPWRDAHLAALLSDAEVPR